MNKERSTPAELSKFFAQCNLNMHIRYYNNHRRVVANQIADITKELEDSSLDPKRKQDLKVDKHILLNSYHQHMIINCFLTMYSHFEECLGGTCLQFSTKMPKNRRSGLERFKEHFEMEHDLKLARGPHWPFVCDCASTRDVLLHTGGNVALARDKKKVEDLIRRNSSYLAKENSRLILKEQLLVCFSEKISEFTEWVVDQAACC